MQPRRILKVRLSTCHFWRINEWQSWVVSHLAGTVLRFRSSVVEEMDGTVEWWIPHDTPINEYTLGYPPPTMPVKRSSVHFYERPLINLHFPLLVGRGYTQHMELYTQENVWVKVVSLQHYRLHLPLHPGCQWKGLSGSPTQKNIRILVVTVNMWGRWSEIIDETLWSMK